MDNGEYASSLKPFHRSADMFRRPQQDAVLNWGGGQNNNTVLPGGEEDTPAMPQGAATASGVDAIAQDAKFSSGTTRELTRAGIPGFFKGQQVTIQESTELKWKLPAKFGVKAEKGVTVRYRVTNSEGKSAWLEEGDLE